MSWNGFPAGSMGTADQEIPGLIRCQNPRAFVLPSSNAAHFVFAFVFLQEL